MKPKKVNTINKDGHSRKKDSGCLGKELVERGLEIVFGLGRMESLHLISNICDDMGRGPR